MQESKNLKDVSIFSGYSHIGRCREFVWVPGDTIGHQQMTSTFILRGLVCSYDIESLMIRKDLYLQTSDGKEYLVSNFRLTDVEDFENIVGVAESCDFLHEKFPELKTFTEGEEVSVSKKTQVMAFKVISSTINNVRIGQSVETESAKEVVNNMVEEIFANPDAIVNLINIKSFDDYTCTHNINVATLALLIGQELKLPPADLQELGLGCLMHDVGKLKVPLAILNKDGKLSNQEFDEIKKHPSFGYEILSASKEITERSRLVALQHHEKFQGRGYPKDLSGENISLFARICSVADVYDALTTDRPYRVAMFPYDAVKIVMSGMENQFDPQIAQAFIRKFSIYPSGSLVFLNDGSIGLILKVSPRTVLRPTIKLIRDNKGVHLKRREEIDLMNCKNLFISGPADPKFLNVKKKL